jgi:ADP-heptose:LPS heptosyltransferase
MRSRNILVIKLGALGDVVLSLPQITALVEAHARDRVTLLTAPAFAGLAAGLPLQVVAFRRKGFIEMLRVMRWLPGQQFDVVYDLQGSLRSRVMTLLTRAGKRVGRCPGLAYTHAAPVPAAGIHAFDRFNEVLVAAGLEPASPRLRLPVSAAATSRVAGWLQQQGLEGRQLVPVHAGSSRQWPSKRWPEDCFRSLAVSLEERGLKVVWIGGEDERTLNARLAAHAGVDATAAFGLAELLALADHAVFAVTNDSGPMHVLSAAALPVYAFFGPTDWRCSHALGQAERVFFNKVPCSPCHLPVCPPERGHACMQDITPETVLARLEADGLLQNAGRIKERNDLPVNN